MSENEKPKVSVSMLTEENPDFEKNDALGRAQFAGRLTDIVENAAEHKSFAMSLHGGWGTGKTYLLRGWQKQLQKKGRQVVYFNAWEDDFQADPLTAIVGQLWNTIKESDSAEIKESLKSLFGNLGEKVLGVVGATRGDFQSVAERTVDGYLTMRAELDDLKKRLEEFAKKVKEGQTKFPLVFIVDELDRCRPTFAIEVLERVKHLFGAPNIVFVFGVNKEVLGESIKSVYGNIDTEDYLRRFFDIGLTLPPANASAYCRFLLERPDLDAVMKQMDRIDNPRYRASEGWLVATDRIFSDMMDCMHFSLREVEHAIRLVRFAIKARISSSKRETPEEAWSISLLILLKMRKAAMYADFVGGKLQCADIINHFHDLLVSHSNEQKVQGQGHSHDHFYIVELAMYRFGKEEEITGGLDFVLGKTGQFGFPSSAMDCLAERTKKHTKETKNLSIVITRRGSDYWLSLKEMAALLDLADDFR